MSLPLLRDELPGWVYGARDETPSRKVDDLVEAWYVPDDVDDINVIIHSRIGAAPGRRRIRVIFDSQHLARAARWYAATTGVAAIVSWPTAAFLDWPVQTSLGVLFGVGTGVVTSALILLEGSRSTYGPVARTVFYLGGFILLAEVYVFFRAALRVLR